MEKQPTCEERVEGHLDSRINDIKQLMDAMFKGDEEVVDLGNMYEYGLSFDYVAGDTKYNDGPGYFRYQISWGGPADEFRFFTDPDMYLHKIEYWFLDWWDGARRALYGTDETLMRDVFEWFRECGSVEAELERSQNER